MDTTKLEMIFLSADNKKLTLAVDDPKPDLESFEVEGAMNSIIENGIFTVSGSDIIEIENARIVTRTVENII